MTQQEPTDLPKVGSVWRSHYNPNQTCLVVSSSPLRVEAFWTERSSETFRAATGLFKSNFCPESEICTIKTAAMAQASAVTQAQRELINEVLQHVEARLNALPSLMETDKDKALAANLADLVKTELSERLFRLRSLPATD